MTRRLSIGASQSRLQDRRGNGLWMSMSKVGIKTNLPNRDTLDTGLSFEMLEPCEGKLSRTVLMGRDRATTHADLVPHITLMETIWTKSKWSYENLEGKTVEFKITIKTGRLHGIGRFLVRQNPGGLLALDVTVDVAKGWSERVAHRYRIPQAGVDLIESHPDQSVAQFRLFA